MTVRDATLNDNSMGIAFKIKCKIKNVSLKILKALGMKKIKDLVLYRKKDYKKIIMVGTFNQINAGDEAQIDSTIKIMMERYPDYLVKVLSHVPKYTYENHYHCVVGPNPRVSIWNHDENPGYYYAMDNRIIKWKFLLNGYWMCLNAYLVRADLPVFFLSAKKASLLQDLKTSDLVYFSGGGGMTGATLSRCWDFMFTMKIAKILKVPCVMSGQNCGLWNSNYTKKLVSRTLKYAKAITLRDPYAVENLREIGVFGNHIFAMFDDALFCDKCSDVQGYLNEYGIGDDKYIAFHMHYYGIEDNNEEQTRLIEKLCAFLDYMIEKTHLKILLIPAATVDAKPMEDLMEAYKNPMLKIARFRECDFRVIRGLMARAELTVTMKHHPIVYSIGECVPTLSIAYKPYYLYKNKGALEIFGLGKYSLDLEQDSYMDDFKELFDDIWDNKVHLRKQIKHTLDLLKDRREKFFGIVDKILEGENI